MTRSPPSGPRPPRKTASKRSRSTVGARKSTGTSRAKTPPKTASTRLATAPARAYHHGDLRRALVEAAYDLVAEGGAETVSVREAARRAGVSPGAPFRHFPSRDALMAAVAAEAQRRFRREIADALVGVPDSEPLARFRALGRAYLRWAMRNPGHFAVISDGRLFDYGSAAGEAAALRADNAQIIDQSARWLAEAAAMGQLRFADIKLLQIAARALVYGYARMNTDGHFPRWGVAAAEIAPMAERVLDLFLAAIAAPDHSDRGPAQRD
jgi:AcrR family transcriptional regulator